MSVFADSGSFPMDLCGTVRVRFGLNGLEVDIYFGFLDHRNNNAHTCNGFLPGCLTFLLVPVPVYFPSEM